jgi:hypothetical protein
MSNMVENIHNEDIIGLLSSLALKITSKDLTKKFKELSDEGKIDEILDKSNIKIIEAHERLEKERKLGRSHIVTGKSI